MFLKNAKKNHKKEGNEEKYIFTLSFLPSWERAMILQFSDHGVSIGKGYIDGSCGSMAVANVLRACITWAVVEDTTLIWDSLKYYVGMAGPT